MAIATVKASLSYSNGAATESLSFGPLTITLSGTKFLKNRQTVGITAEALEIGDIAVPGMLLFVNKDATNYVEVRDGDSGADVVKVLAGEAALFRLATATPYVIANTAACECEYFLIET
jgi:hypothetical protein